MFNSLTRKILGTMILLTSICTLSFTVVSYYKVQDSMITQMQNDGTALATSLRREISNYGNNDLNQVQDVFKDMKDESSGNIVYISVADSSLNILVSDSSKIVEGSSIGNDKEESGKDTDAVSSATEQEDVSTVISMEKISGFIFRAPDGEKVYNVSAPLAMDNGFKGALNIGISLKGMYRQIIKTMKEILFMTLIIQIIAVLLGLIFARTLTKPLTRIVHKLNDFEKGDFTIEFIAGSNDEIGKLSYALNKSVKVLKETIGAVKDTANQLYGTAQYLSRSSDEAAVSSGVISQGISEVADVIDGQNSNISSIVNALEIFGRKLDNMLSETDKVLASSMTIKGAADMSYNNLEGLVNSIHDVRDSFNTAIEEINSLHANIGKINEITGVINSVAKQTNLLALNAAIESARAGEAGRGFGVVAEEIRKLADQVMRSSENINIIANVIETSARDVVHSSVSIADKMSTQIGFIKDSVNSCNDIIVEVDKCMPQVQNVAASLKDVYGEKEKIVIEVGEISGVSEQISNTAQEISLSAQQQTSNVQQLPELAQSLNYMADRLKSSIDTFKI